MCRTGIESEREIIFQCAAIILKCEKEVKQEFCRSSCCKLFQEDAFKHFALCTTNFKVRVLRTRVYKFESLVFALWRIYFWRKNGGKRDERTRHAAALCAHWVVIKLQSHSFSLQRYKFTNALRFLEPFPVNVKCCQVIQNVWYACAICSWRAFRRWHWCSWKRSLRPALLAFNGYDTQGILFHLFII
jgi:hypothetical protein